VTVINNLPAILVEEIVPTTVNDSTLLAPEEVHIRPKGDVKADTERTDTDKKHARRLLKHKLKLKSKDQPKKSDPEEAAKGK
jgi:U3 small nucleolar RNA-associated protein MPP10